ncbi:MAG: HDOD domain-containing protein [Cycloclasticus sp.]|nr:HDOD domain-containing protein [Cycloclasticus sp.]
MTQTVANIFSLDDFLTGEIDLCSPPEIFMRVSQALDDQNKQAQDIANIIEQDPSLAVRMLKIVNSAFFGFPATVKTISRAVTILGHREIRLLVMTTSVVEKFSNMPNSLLDMREFWGHSLKVALFSKYLAEQHPKKRQLSSAFISGLLHDIGRLILYMKAPDLARASALLVKAKGISEIDAEKETFGFSHADLGGALLGMWKIPESIQTATAFHHQPELATDNKEETMLVCLANLLAHADTTSEDSIQESISAEDPIWESIDMPYGVIIPVSSEVESQFSRTYSMFFGS